MLNDFETLLKLPDPIKNFNYYYTHLKMWQWFSTFANENKQARVLKMQIPRLQPRPIVSNYLVDWISGIFLNFRRYAAKI